MTKTKNIKTLSAPGGHVERLDELGPKFAAELLGQLHPNQRRLRKSHVTQLATAMREGRWRWTADPIKLDKDLRVIDGQHRLAAIVESGVTLKDVLVATLEDPEAFKSLDQNIPRSLGDMMTSAGRKTVPRTISGAIVCEKFDWKDWRGRLGREEQMVLIEEFPFMEEVAAMRKASPRAAYIFTVGPLSTAIRCMRVNREAALAFFTAAFAMNPVVYGEPNDYVRLLYTFLQQRPNAGTPSGPKIIIEQAWKSMRAWNAWRTQEKISRLVYNPGSPIPTPEP
jgi:hypothetical protein